MFGVDDAILASAAGAAIGGGLSYFGQNSANAANKDISNKQMAFQAGWNQKAMDYSTEMSNTAWQRGVADMKKAGINPMLAFSKGGASAPTGVTSGGASIPMQNAFQNAPASVSSAISAITKKAELDNMRKQNQVLDSQINLNNQNASSAKAQATLASNNAAKVGLSIPGAKNQAALESTWFGKYLPYAERSIGVAGDAFGALASPFVRVIQALKGKSPSKVTDYYDPQTGEVRGTTRHY